MNNKTDIRRRIIHPVCNQLVGENKVVDRDAIIRNCIIFDHFIITSYGLEIPDLVDIFGYEGFIELLKNKVISFNFEVLFQGLKDVNNLPANVYNPTLFKPSDMKDPVSKCLQNVNEIKDVSYKQEIKLKGIIANYFTTNTKLEMDNLFLSFSKDMTSNYELKSRITKFLSLTLGKNIDDNLIKVHVENIKEGYRIETNISEFAKLGNITERYIVEKSIFSILATNHIFHDMVKHNALPAFKQDEISIYNNKLLTIVNNYAANRPADNFTKIVELSDFPDFNNVTIDVHNLLKIRDSEECILFRNWLWSVDNIEDSEIKDVTNGFRNKIGLMLNTPSAKVIRWLASTSLGVIDPVSSTAVSIFDTFVLEKLLPRKGLTAFLNSMLPSVFNVKKL